MVYIELKTLNSKIDELRVQSIKPRNYSINSNKSNDSNIIYENYDKYNNAPELKDENSTQSSIMDLLDGTMDAGKRKQEFYDFNDDDEVLLFDDLITNNAANMIIPMSNTNTIFENDIDTGNLSDNINRHSNTEESKDDIRNDINIMIYNIYDKYIFRNGSNVINISYPTLNTLLSKHNSINSMSLFEKYQLFFTAKFEIEKLLKTNTLPTFYTSNELSQFMQLKSKSNKKSIKLKSLNTFSRLKRFSINTSNEPEIISDNDFAMDSPSLNSIRISIASTLSSPGITIKNPCLMALPNSQTPLSFDTNYATDEDNETKLDPFSLYASIESNFNNNSNNNNINKKLL